MPKFFDSHAHLTSDSVYTDIDKILHYAQEANVTKITNICTNHETLKRGLILAEAHSWIYNTAATTPHDVDKEGDLFFPEVKKMAGAGKLVAIGETGLDYHYQHSKVETQKHFLRKYLQLALETKLPVIIHCREAFDDFFRILDEEYQPNGQHAPGVLHCFTGTVEEAKEVLARGWFLSLSGIVTFKKSDELREVARITPLNQLLIETDTPYLAPQSHRGKPNQPAYIVETAACIAEEKGLSLQEVASATKENAAQFFDL